MELPKNRFKEALLAGRQQIGLWNVIRDPNVAEMLAQLGYDWLVIDCEHTPRDLENVVSCLQAMQGTHATPVVRVTANDTAEIKRVLDAGAQTVLVPFVQNAGGGRKGSRCRGLSAPRVSVALRVSRVPPPLVVWAAILRRRGTRSVSSCRWRAKRRSIIWKTSPP